MGVCGAHHWVTPTAPSAQEVLLKNMPWWCRDVGASMPGWGECGTLEERTRRTVESVDAEGVIARDLDRGRGPGAVDADDPAFEEAVRVRRGIGDIPPGQSVSVARGSGEGTDHISWRAACTVSGARKARERDFIAGKAESLLPFWGCPFIGWRLLSDGASYQMTSLIRWRHYILSDKFAGRCCHINATLPFRAPGVPAFLCHQPSPRFG